MFALSFEVSKKFIIFAPEHCLFVALRNYALCHKQLWAQGDCVILVGNRSLYLYSIEVHTKIPTRIVTEPRGIGIHLEI